LTASDISSNTGSLACPPRHGTGHLTLHLQSPPALAIPYPDCGGSPYAPDPQPARPGALALPHLHRPTAAQALHPPGAHAHLGLGYLTLGEDTPALSGGEAQRLKLATQLQRDQSDAVFVLDEPSVGLHPLDVRTLLHVLQRLADRGATVVVIEHDLDLVANADYVVDMGPGGGEAGGRIVAVGTPDTVAGDSASVTGRYLAAHLRGPDSARRAEPAASR